MGCPPKWLQVLKGFLSFPERLWIFFWQLLPVLVRIVRLLSSCSVCLIETEWITTSSVRRIYGMWIHLKKTDMSPQISWNIIQMLRCNVPRIALTSSLWFEWCKHFLIFFFWFYSLCPWLAWEIDASWWCQMHFFPWSWCWSSTVDL